MKTKHYLVSFLLAMSFIVMISFATSVSASEADVPVYSSVEEWELSGDTSDIVRIKQDSKLRYMGGYYEYKLVETKKNNDVRVGYHPNFSSWGYWDGYYFSTTGKVTFTPNVTLNWGVVSVGVSVAKSASSSGTFKKADGSKRSRPWVRADITTKIYDQLIYDDSGNLLLNNKKGHKKSTSSDVQIFIAYQ